MNATISIALEAVSAGCSILYSLLLMREQRLGWLFGIASAVLGSVVLLDKKLYAQSAIQLYFVAIGIYGWLYWSKAAKRNEHIHKWPLANHAWAIAVCTLVSFLVARFFIAYTDSPFPILDSTLTVFGLLASIKEARKILSSWLYWLVINIGSAVLYYQQQLQVYAVLMAVYAIICIPGYISWLRIYKQDRLQ